VLRLVSIQLPGRRVLLSLSIIAALRVAGSACADEAAALTAGSGDLGQFVSSATRFKDRVEDVPLALTVVRGDDLAAQGVHDVSTALESVVGVTTGPGGDDGSAGVSIGLLGRREIDDFLLVVDGVPLGGAFTPQFAAVSVDNVERVEVLRGTAPVYFGTTAFAGTIAIDHPAAGYAPPVVNASVGLRGAYHAAAAGSVDSGSVRQSLFADVTSDQASDPRAGFTRSHALWRLAGDVGASHWRVDAEWTDLNDRPASPTPFEGATALLPTDFNQNPVGSVLARTIGKITVGYESTLGDVPWSTLASWTTTRYHGNQGFVVDPTAPDDGANATGFSQQRHVTDQFLDTHLTWLGRSSVDVTAGLNVLSGRLSTDNATYTYGVPLDGSTADPLSAVAITGESALRDSRTVLGAYVQSNWHVTPALTVLSGLRYNYLSENQTVGSEDGSTQQRQVLRRLSGSLGADETLFRATTGAARVSLYGSIGTTFQPPQIDLGPDPSAGPLLAPETLNGIVVGARGHTAGAWELDAAYHRLDIRHRAVTELVDGLPQLVATGAENVRGVEIEAQWRPSESLRLSLEYSHNNATYGHYPLTTDGGDTVDLAGSAIELVPNDVARVALDWHAAHGWQAAVSGKYVGRRTVAAGDPTAFGGYYLLSAYLGYRFEQLTLWARADNLTDRRDPTVASEFGEGQIYRLQGRRAVIGVSWRAR
jgi:iron complex outermembrane recepter protein